MTNTLRRFAGSGLAIPPTTAWYLSDLGEFRGKQELYTRQSPQRLKALRPDSVLATMPGTMQDERALHARFGPLWDHGEYFRAEPELMAYIDEVRATQDTRQPA